MKADVNYMKGEYKTNPVSFFYNDKFSNQ